MGTVRKRSCPLYARAGVHNCRNCVIILSDPLCDRAATLTICYSSRSQLALVWTPIGLSDSSPTGHLKMRGSCSNRNGGDVWPIRRITKWRGRWHTRAHYIASDRVVTPACRTNRQKARQDDGGGPLFHRGRNHHRRCTARTKAPSASSLRHMSRLLPHRRMESASRAASSSAPRAYTPSLEIYHRPTKFFKPRDPGLKSSMQLAVPPRCKA